MEKKYKIEDMRDNIIRSILFGSVLDNYVDFKSQGYSFTINLGSRKDNNNITNFIINHIEEISKVDIHSFFSNVNKIDQVKVNNNCKSIKLNPNLEVKDNCEIQTINNINTENDRVNIIFYIETNIQ